jgi:hypothetical protein
MKLISEEPLSACAQTAPDIGERSLFQERAVAGVSNMCYPAAERTFSNAAQK